jgi:hypothetical protein
VADEPSHAVIPFELEAGVYAESLAGWFTADALVLDFAAENSGQLLVTSRIRIPVTAALKVRTALDAVIQDYELQYGEIRQPRLRGDE